MELGKVIAEASMAALAKVASIRGIASSEAGPLTEALRQVLREDAMSILDALKDAAFMGEAMSRAVLNAECMTAAIKAVDLYQAS